MTNESDVILWECPDCAFGFDAFHKNTDGTYTCPVCENFKLRRLLSLVANEAIIAGVDKDGKPVKLYRPDTEYEVKRLGSVWNEIAIALRKPVEEVKEP